MIMFKIIKKRMYFFLYMFFFLVVQCAYFNTFYNAEKYFESALSIIQKAPALNDSKIPSNAIDLLDKAILNSNTIVKKYSDSKYVPEAYFLMGVSYFYKESYSSAIENFNLIDLDSFKRPNQLRLWLAYAFLRINDNDQFNKYMNKFTPVEKIEWLIARNKEKFPACYEIAEALVANFNFSYGSARLYFRIIV